MEKKLKTVSDALGIAPFYPDLPRVELGEMLGEPFVLEDAKILKDFEGDFGSHDLALLKIELKGQSFTTACSGSVVVKKVAALLDKKLLPLQARVLKNERYYDIV